MACYDFDYAVQLLRQAVDFAEIEHDFAPLRKWVNDVEQSGHETESIDARLNLPAGQDIIMATLQSVASGSLSPEKASQCIRLWLNHDQEQDQRVELTKQYQFV
jgi:hypothetical protein